jgi:hypothetical protein
MDVRRFVEELVTQANANAQVIEMIEDTDAYRVRIAGTTGVVVSCELPRGTVQAAADRSTARRRLASVLKRCADETVAPIPDARG